jgi:hypothetical protein
LRRPASVLGVLPASGAFVGSALSYPRFYQNPVRSAIRIRPRRPTEHDRQTVTFRSTFGGEMRHLDTGDKKCYIDSRGCAGPEGAFC